MNTVELVRECKRKNILLSPDFLNFAEDLPSHLEEYDSSGGLVLTKDSVVIPKEKFQSINWREFEKTRSLYERGQRGELYKKFVDFFHSKNISMSEIIATESPLEINFSYAKESQKRTVEDFIDHLTIRFKSIEKLLRSRPELSTAVSLSRIIGRVENEPIAFIGMVNEITLTKNENIMLTIEDQTGSIKVIVSKSKPELFDQCKDIVHDEIIGIVGAVNNKVVFANQILWPDVPLTHEYKKSPDEVYSVFMSDTEFGSKMFLYDEFERFLAWINGEMGNEVQKNIASKVRYLFIAGDIVNGVGIYPHQENDLEILDIYAQYERAAQMIKRIPKSIKIIIGPGNHDALRLSEPQPPLDKEIAKPLYELENVTMVSNPAIITMHKSKDFPGFKVLMYHGFSFTHFADKVPSLRQAGGVARSDLIMKFLLKRRHLAVSHTSNLYIPDATADHLVIDTIPDFFISGHVHTYSVSNYRNVTMTNCSCWIHKTPFQEKLGIEPAPGRILIANLQTREVKVMKF